MSIRIYGVTSGFIELDSPPVGNSASVTLPTTNGVLATESFANTAGGLVYITGQSFNAVSSLSVNNCFNSNYDNYRIVLRCTSSSSFEINMRMRLSGTDNTTANCAYQDLNISGTTATAARYSSLTSMFIAALSTSYNVLSMDLFDPAAAIPTTYHVIEARQANSSSPETRFLTGGHNVSTAYDGFSLIISSGTITGTLRIYGYRNS